MTKSCFVIMGFHEKTDFQTGRVLDLDKTYKGIIKPAAEDAGFECVRADEVQHAGVIDIPMYDRLLKADLVIADLSTLNPNAFFELGVRYALRPCTTIVIAESEFKNPFDTNHISVRRYRHDGKALDFEVVDEFRMELTNLINAVVASGNTDSPVYSQLHGLTPPAMEEVQEASRPSDTQTLAAAGADDCQDAQQTSFAQMVELVMALRIEQKFKEMADILTGIRAVQGDKVEDFVIQQLAFATYKSQLPTPTQALVSAREILRPLEPAHSMDAETIGLWGAVHKRLANAEDRSEAEREADLDEAINALQRGFQLLRDEYNGINAAFLLDLRAHRGGGEEAIADRVIARRIRSEVLEITRALAERPLAGTSLRHRAERRYWIEATHAEALFGLGRQQEAQALLDTAASREGVEGWMKDTTESQLAMLEQVLL